MQPAPFFSFFPFSKQNDILDILKKEHINREVEL